MEIGLFEMRVTTKLKLSSSCLLIEIYTMTSVKDNNIIYITLGFTKKLLKSNGVT